MHGLLVALLVVAAALLYLNVMGAFRNEPEHFTLERPEPGDLAPMKNWEMYRLGDAVVFTSLRMGDGGGYRVSFADDAREMRTIGQSHERHFPNSIAAEYSRRSKGKRGDTETLASILKERCPEETRKNTTPIVGVRLGDVTDPEVKQYTAGAVERSVDMQQYIRVAELLRKRGHSHARILAGIHVLHASPEKAAQYLAEVMRLFGEHGVSTEQIPKDPDYDFCLLAYSPEIYITPSNFYAAAVAAAQIVNPGQIVESVDPNKVDGIARYNQEVAVPASTYWEVVGLTKKAIRDVAAKMFFMSR